MAMKTLNTANHRGDQHKTMVGDAHPTCWAAAAVGHESVLIPEQTMGGEDFAFYLQRTPGCFIFLGAGRPNVAPLHSPFFDFSEDILLTGVEIYCRAALDLLRENG